MAMNDSLLFLGLSLATFVGFALKALYRHYPDSFKELEYSLFNTIMQGLFILALIVFWLIMIFKQ